MAIVGHWTSLTEAQKLVQSILLAGIVEEVIEEGQLIPVLPVFQIDSKSVKYNREDQLPSAAFYAINEQIPWTSDVSYSAQVEVELKRVLRQDPLDKFMRDTYKNPNDYRAVVLSGLQKGCMRTIENKIIYGDKDNVNAKEFDGLHAFASEQTSVASGTEGLNINGASGALSLMDMRLLLDAVKISQRGPGNVFWLMPHEIARRIDAHVQEAGIASYVGPYNVNFTINDVGRRVTMFDGIPIVRSDYMVAEQEDTAEDTTSARAVWSSSTVVYSVFLIRTGQVMDGGLSMAFGGAEGGALGEFYGFENFDKLEDYDAEGLRLKAYVALALGSTKSLGRIYDVSNLAVTA